MRFAKALSLAVVAFALASPSAMAQTAATDGNGVEQISRFSASITVREDASIEVSEEITAYFPEPRHGIDREIPIHYRDSHGFVRNVKLTVVSVTDKAGQVVPYSISTQGDDLRVRIGDPDHTVTGEHVYVIDYVVRRALLFFDDHDELYWNVSGDAWRIPLRNIVGSVELPPGISDSDVTTSCYTGPRGSTASDCTVASSDGLFVWSAREPLTVAIGWPKGHVVAPTSADLVRDFLLDNVIFAVPILVLIAMLWTWWTRGRDPKTGTVMAEYEPPLDMTPVEVSALVRMSVPAQAISAAIVDLAVRGYLKIAEREEKVLLWGTKEYALVRTKEADADLPASEKGLFEAVFDGRDSVIVSELAKDRDFQKARSRYQSDVMDSLVSAGHFAANPGTVRALYIGAAIAVAVVTGMSSEPIESWFGVAGIISFMSSAAMVAAFGIFMPRRLQKGAETYRQAMGFKLYLKMAEKHRIEWQVTENMFEKFLPYAMAFGVVDAWGRAFEGMTVPKPDWYDGSAGFAFTPASFATSLGGFGAATAHATMPSSSGSSGGGSSGGGGGGGGGGSW